MRQGLFATASLTALAFAVAAPHAAIAQDEGGVSAFRDTIVVTATKKAQAEDVQDVPLAVTAYGADQLDALKVRDLANLSYSMPNVGLEDIGTSRGIANFSIRGLGVNSSIPSIDPAVGTFVDGVYLGQNAGVVLDIFDLESIEVLRGPQGILFGRNVTGGAVLINTKQPNLNEFEASFKGAVESGLRNTGANYYAMGSVSGPLVEGVLALKLSAYYNNDRGYHRRYLGGPNLEAALAQSAVSLPPPPVSLGIPISFLPTPIAVNQPDEFVNHGKAETWIVRPQLLWQPTDNVSLMIKYEHFDSEGDGPSSQNHPGFVQPPFNPVTMMTPSKIPNPNQLFSAPKDSFIFSIDFPGFYTAEADSVTAELNIDVPFGDGTITNIFGWRDTFGTSGGDIDATPFWLFHSDAINDYEQISNEIRYAGRFFDALDMTVGFYYFSADHIYEENRFLLGGLSNRFGGGTQDSRNYGVFGQLEYDLTDTFSLIGGVRYTNERKSAALTQIIDRGPGTACSTAAGECPIDFAESFTWKNVTPKVGVRWEPRDALQVYAHWTQGVRSGGYNFRNTSSTAPIARFDEESVDSFEFGFKAQPADGKAVINFATFLTKIDDMQREINLPDPAAGVVQLIRNSADATIFGIEIEGRLFVTDNLLLTGDLGRLDGEYDQVFEDINSDGVINDTDLTLMIPRLAPWTYGAGFLHTLDLGELGTVDTRFNWSHRDNAAYTDNNLGILNGADIIDASIALNLNDRATISIYGQNLLHEVTHGGETQLPTFSLGGGSFAPLNKGRIVGIELQLSL